MTETYVIGSRVVYIPTGQAGVVVRVYDDALLVEVGRGDYRRWPLADVVKRDEKR